MRWLIGAVVAGVACGGGGPAGPDASGGADARDVAAVTAAEVFDPAVVRRFELTVAPADWEEMIGDRI